MGPYQELFVRLWSPYSTWSRSHKSRSQSISQSQEWETAKLVKRIRDYFRKAAKGLDYREGMPPQRL